MSQFAGAVIAAALALAGCGGETGGAAVLPARGMPVAAAPSATRSTEQIAAEAVAVVKAYYAEINRAITTGDTTALAAMQTGECACRRLVGAIDETWTAGHTVSEPRVFVPARFEPRDVYPAVASVTVTYATNTYELRDRGGRVVRRIDGRARIQEEIEVVKEGVRWVVSDVRQLSS
ncbi:MAG TPA: hypothetical protein VNA14_00770 [Mycobacteriales bacterium]|nr:hypothetical protein [Mycobacteriales bacterium]